MAIATGVANHVGRDTYSNIVVSTSGSKTSLAMSFKVGRVYRRVVVVPGYKKGGSLHLGSGVGSRPDELLGIKDGLFESGWFDRLVVDCRPSFDG